jgi:hypothetical protein
MLMTSFVQLCSLDSMRARARGGSKGNWDIALPIGVMEPDESIAPRHIKMSFDDLTEDC